MTCECSPFQPRSSLTTILGRYPSCRDRGRVDDGLGRLRCPGALTSCLAAIPACAIQLALTKEKLINIRRGEGGVEQLGGPSWSPAGKGGAVGHPSGLQNG